MKNQVVDVFSGGIRTENFKSGVLPTGYLRSEVDGAIEVTKSGINGDELALKRALGRENHALYLFNSAHYAFYEEHLGRRIQPGMFAENITYAGQDETELRIGDVLKIGTVTIALTTPRVPCFKLSHFLQAQQSFPTFFSETGKTGAYARVIETGELKAGDAITLVSTNTENATISELNEALTGFSFDPDVIDKVLASPDLLPHAAKIICDRIDVFSSGSVGLSSVPAVIQGRSQIAHNTSTIKIWTSSEMSWQPGHFISIGIKGSDGAKHHRCYSLINCEATRTGGTELEIAVRNDAKSQEQLSISSHLVEGAIDGLDIDLYPPSGDFTPPKGKTTPRLYIAGGIGITPILAHLRFLKDDAPTRLIYICRNRDAAVFLEEIDAIANKKRNLQFELWLTRDDHLDGASLGRPDLKEIFGRLEASTETFVCGPVGLIEAAKQLHNEAGRDAGKLHYELFELPKMSIGTQDPAIESQLIIEPKHLVGKWTTQGQTLLDWIEANTPYRPPAACRSGLCRTCQAQLEVGTVTYPAGINPPAHGKVLLCCARPVTDQLVIRLPESAMTAIHRSKAEVSE